MRIELLLPDAERAYMLGAAIGVPLGILLFWWILHWFDYEPAPDDEIDRVYHGPSNVTGSRM